MILHPVLLFQPSSRGHSLMRTEHKLSLGSFQLGCFPFLGLYAKLPRDVFTHTARSAALAPVPCLKIGAVDVFFF